MIYNLNGSHSNYCNVFHDFLSNIRKKILEGVDVYIERVKGSRYYKMVDGLELRSVGYHFGAYGAPASTKYCLKCIVALVNVLHLLDFATRQAMGYIYKTVDHAK